MYPEMKAPQKEAVDLPECETQLCRMNAKRGYLPEDDINFTPDAVQKMRTASRHVRYLINEGYDLKQASTFVGNHFCLSERQRLAVMRSAATNDQLFFRRSRQISFSALAGKETFAALAGKETFAALTDKETFAALADKETFTSLAGKEVWIDGFNTIITLEVLLSDSPLFECMDGAIRDLAALLGTYRLIPETIEAIRLLFGILTGWNVTKANILLDEPVSNSGRLKCLMAEIGEAYSLELDIRILKDVDRTLYGKEFIITSDSIILDHCGSWINLVSECMRKLGREGIRLWDGEEDDKYEPD